jgi:hypothetical protein
VGRTEQEEEIEYKSFDAKEGKAKESGEEM